MLDLILIYTALAFFAAGMIYKASAWFRFSPSVDAAEYPPRKRVVSALRGIILTVLSPKVFTLLKVFLLDVVLQRRIFVRSPLGWFVHMSIFLGFMVLLFMHALSKYVASAFVSEYYSTINPFFFLRDLFGVLVLVGVVAALVRRFTRKGLVPGANVMDVYALVILAVIMLSGVILEGAKMTSHSVFSDMVDEYMVGGDDEEMQALESYWVAEFGLVSPDIKAPAGKEVLARGREAHEMSCAQCHASNRSAFAGYAFAKTAGPVAAPALDAAATRAALYYVHLLACLIGLAYLPFSKMFHVFSVPICLMANAVMKKGKSDPANMATRLMVELDACTHCGSCTRACSVATVFLEFENDNILPSERMAVIRDFATGKALDAESMLILQQGIHVCTDCGKCAEACTSGIDLTNLWSEVRETLLQRAVPEYALLTPLSLQRALARQSMDEERYAKPIEIAEAAVLAGWDRESLENKARVIVLGNGGMSDSMRQKLKHISSAGCYRCKTCSNSCPVVRNYPDAGAMLGLLPHQMMHAIGLGLWDMVFSSKMLWNCLGCSQCQECCPQCIRIADVFCELRNEAIALAGVSHAGDGGHSPGKDVES